MDPVFPGTTKDKQVSYSSLRYVLFGVFFLGLFAYYSFSAPTDTQAKANRQPTIIHVKEGESLSALSSELESRHIVRSQRVLKVFLTVLNFDKQIERGDYLFDKSMSLPSVAWMLARSDHRISPLRVTLREGITNEEIASILSVTLQNFRKDLFLADAHTKQGYLFPDTYFFFPYTTTSEVVDEMDHTFSKRIKPFAEDIKNSSHTEDEIITMASILEKEAHGKDDSSLISGILWKRIKLGMPLQVDAAKETYVKKGLPNAPISNPGIASITSALKPTDSPYLFYLHSKDGTVHFARTYAEHKVNIARYLK